MAPVILLCALWEHTLSTTIASGRVSLFNMISTYLLVLASIVVSAYALQTTSAFYDGTTSTVASSLPRYPPSLASDRQAFGTMSPYGYQNTMNPALASTGLQQPFGLYGAQQNLGYYGSLGNQQTLNPLLGSDPRILALLQDPQILSYILSIFSTGYPSTYGSFGSTSYLRGQDPYLLGNRGYLGQYDPMGNSYYGSSLGSQYGLDSTYSAGLGNGMSSYPGRYSSYGYQQTYPYASGSTIRSSSVNDKTVKRDPKYGV